MSLLLAARGEPDPPVPVVVATADYSGGHDPRKPEAWKQDPAIAFELARYLLETDEGPEIVEASPERLEQVIEERGATEVRVIPESLLDMPSVPIGRAVRVDPGTARELRKIAIEIGEYKRLMREREEEEAFALLLLH